MLRSRSNTSGYTSYFWKKPWKSGLFSWGVEKVYPWACMGCGVVLFYLDRLPVRRGGVPVRAGRQARARGIPAPRSSLDRDRLPRRPPAVALGDRGRALRGRAGRGAQQDQRLPGARRGHGDQRRVDPAEDRRGRRAHAPAPRRGRCPGRSRTRPSGGARGNSGAILAQFFCGFSEGLPDSPRVTTAGLRGRRRPRRRIGLLGDRAPGRGDDPDGDPRLGAERGRPRRATCRTSGCSCPSRSRRRAHRSRTRPSR